MVYRETFLQIHKRFIRQFIQECSILWVDFSITGKIPVHASMERLVIENGDRDNNNRSWAKWLKSQTVFQFSVPIFETRDFSERLKGKDWRKGSRGRTERAVHLKTISTTVLAWMVIAQLHLPVNSVKSVLGCTIRLVNSGARSRSENFAKQSD